ncbi:MAG: IS630 family transposase [Microcoleus vaginatus WJT46-NPBG5]|jgi:transposase|nr:IS630 family transposase [Microcoleus vaginatus WJT46-NPBG5]
MPRAYSTDIRLRVSAAWQGKEGSQRQLAERFKVSLSYVQRVLGRYRQSAQVEAKRRGATVKPKISSAHLEVVPSLVKEQPDVLLEELRIRFAERTGIRVSVPTMHRAVKRLGLRRKKTLYASEQETPRILQMRHEFRRWLEGVDIRNLIFVDEAGVHLSLSRLYARAIGGEPVVESNPRNKGANISLLGALSWEGLIAMMTIPGSVDTPVFLTYLREILIPQLWPGAIVVMDNLKVRYAAVVQAAIEAAGAKLVFLPPYSPDLSPIELCWSKLKQFLRSRAARTLEALNQALTDAISYITEDDALNWFNHCGLFT